MCPICIGTAALAWAGSGSAGGLAALVAVKLRIKRQPERDRIERTVAPKLNLQPRRAGGVK